MANTEGERERDGERTYFNQWQSRKYQLFSRHSDPHSMYISLAFQFPAKMILFVSVSLARPAIQFVHGEHYIASGNYTHREETETESDERRAYNIQPDSGAAAAL